MPSAEPTKDELKTQLEATRRDMEILASMVRERAGATVYEARVLAMARVDELSAEARALIGTAQAEALRGRGFRITAPVTVLAATDTPSGETR